MLVSEVKKIGKVGKNLLKNENADNIIDIIIEKPLQKACKACKEKNIETVMSSANKKNITKKRVNKVEVTKKIEAGKILNFEVAGKGYAWIMVNYNTLSDENRKKFFELEKELGEDTIWFVKSNYVDVMNPIRKFLKLKELVEVFDDKYAEQFRKKQLKLMYNNKYPRRAIFIRMPIDERTEVKEVEEYFDKIISKLNKQ